MIWICYNVHFPLTPARVYSGLVFNGLRQTCWQLQVVLSASVSVYRHWQIMAISNTLTLNTGTENTNCKLKRVGETLSSLLLKQVDRTSLSPGLELTCQISPSLWKNTVLFKALLSSSKSNTCTWRKREKNKCLLAIHWKLNIKRFDILTKYLITNCFPQSQLNKLLCLQVLF